MFFIVVNDHKTYDSFDDLYQIARSSSTNSPRAWIVLRATPWPPSSSLRGSSWRSFRICPPLARPRGCWHRGTVQQKIKGRSLQKPGMPCRCLLVKTSWFPIWLLCFCFFKYWISFSRKLVCWFPAGFFLNRKKHEDFSSKNRALKGVSMVSMCRNLKPT